MAKIATLDECVSYYRQIEAGTGSHRRFAWGTRFLDATLGPARPGSLVVVGADTNTGKSFFSLMICANAPVPTLYVSLEDPPDEIGRRAASLPAKALQRVQVSFQRGSMEEVAETIREACVGAQAPRMVVVDYLNQLSYSGQATVWGRNDEVRECVKELRALTRELGLVIVLAAQTRDRADYSKPPTRYDLAESASIRRSAEVIVMLHAPERGVVVAILDKAKSVETGATATYRRGPEGVLVEVEAEASDVDEMLQ